MLESLQLYLLYGTETRLSQQVIYQMMSADSGISMNMEADLFDQKAQMRRRWESWLD